MARIVYDARAAAGFQAAREIPREGLDRWRDAINRHLSPRPGMTVVDVGAGTGAFSTAIHDWFAVTVLAVEPSEAMRALIPHTSGIEILAGSAEELPIGDSSVDGGGCRRSPTTSPACPQPRQSCAGC